MSTGKHMTDLPKPSFGLCVREIYQCILILVALALELQRLLFKLQQKQYITVWIKIFLEI